MKNLSNKVIAVCFFFLSSFLARGASPDIQEVHVLVKVHSVKEAESQLGTAIELENEGLSQILSGLAPDDEVLLKGKVKYHPIQSEGTISMNPKFHINSIHPVSLKRLGVTDVKVQDPPMVFSTMNYPGPKSIEISPEVAGTITFTASVLLLQDLSGTAETQPLKHQIDRTLFLSSGAFATGYFIWKQMTDKKK